MVKIVGRSSRQKLEHSIGWNEAEKIKIIYKDNEKPTEVMKHD